VESANECFHTERVLTDRLYSVLAPKRKAVADGSASVYGVVRTRVGGRRRMDWNMSSPH